MPTQAIFTLVCLLIALSVMLSGVHVKDVVALSPVVTDGVARHDDQPIKVALELHNHVDKQTGKAFDGPQADFRSLRLRESKHRSVARLH